MKKTKNTSNLFAIISAVISGVTLTVVAGIAVKHRKAVEDLEFKLDILETEIGDMDVESQEISERIDEISEKIKEIDKRKFYTLDTDNLFEEVDIPDDRDIVDIPDDSDIDEDEIL